MIFAIFDTQSVKHTHRLLPKKAPPLRHEGAMKIWSTQPGGTIPMPQTQHKKLHSDSQLSLSLAPPRIQDCLRDAHNYPLAGFKRGGDMVSRRVPPSELWGYPFTEIGQTYTSYCALVFDCDDPDAAELAFYDAAFPRPSWMVENLDNRHLHVGYGLRLPVHRYEAAKPKPLQTLRRVAEYGTRALSADAGFAGVLTRNPEPRNPIPNYGERTKTWWGASGCSTFPSSTCISRKAGGHRVRARPQPELAATWICSATAWLGPGGGRTRTRPCSTTPWDALARSANATPK